MWYQPFMSDADKTLPQTDRLPPLRILLVEDHADTARVLSLLLTREGHQVDVAVTLEQATRFCKDRGYDLLISDIELPDGMAWEILSEGQACFGLKGIVVSGHGMAEHIRRSREAGFSAHLVKPFRIEDLRRAMAEVVS